jgi:hypothetical protein
MEDDNASDISGPVVISAGPTKRVFTRSASEHTPLFKVANFQLSDNGTA